MNLTDKGSFFSEDAYRYFLSASNYHKEKNPENEKYTAKYKKLFKEAPYEKREI